MQVPSGGIAGTIGPRLSTEMAAEWPGLPAKMTLLSQLDQHSVTGHDGIRSRSSSSASSSERTDVLSPLSSPPLSMPSPLLQDQRTVPLLVPPQGDVLRRLPPFDASRRCRSISTSTTPEFSRSRSPRSGPVYEDDHAVVQSGVGDVRERRLKTSFETPGSKLDRLIAHHHQSRRKWESPCPPSGESTERAWAPPRPLVTEQSVDVSGAANVWRSPFDNLFAATANAPMDSHLARAEALAIPLRISGTSSSSVVIPNVQAGSNSNPAAPAAAAPFPQLKHDGPS